MQDDTLYSITGFLSLGFGIYCLVMAFLAIALGIGEPSSIFALIFSAIGILYIISGISILRKGRLISIIFLGFFGVVYLWPPGIPYYLWPMIIMPIVILALFVILFLRQFARE